MVTRFPPEPNGYLHIGHAKSICLNFGIAQEFGGRCHLRFDDTNPAKEEQEYIDAIERDVRWLGFDWGKHLYHASDYFERLYGWAEHLIRAGKAYVDDQTPGRDARQPRHADRARQEQPVPRPRAWRKTSICSAACARANFPMARACCAPRSTWRPATSICAIRCCIAYCNAPHPRTGTTWKIYPSYDFAHGQSDAIEGITHSICTLEFEDHRPLYDWFLDNLPVPSRPRQYEFARLNLTYTVLSKRVLTELVRGGHVTGWDDPRMPTLAGLRRRGVPPEAIRDFVKRIGVAKANSVVDVGMFEYSVREVLNKTALRRMAVLRPLKVVIENYPEGQVEELDAVNHPDDPAAGIAQDQVRPRALHRAGRFHGEPAEEILPPVAGHGGAVALRLFHHLPRSGEERRRRSDRTALHLRSGHQGRQRAGRPQGEGDDALGVGSGCASRPRCGSTIRCSRKPDPNAARTSPPISIRTRWKCCAAPGWSRRWRDANAGAGAVRAQGYFCLDPRHSPASWCSTAPSACATPGPRKGGGSGKRSFIYSILSYVILRAIISACI